MCSSGRDTLPTTFEYSIVNSAVAQLLTKRKGKIFQPRDHLGDVGAGRVQLLGDGDMSERKRVVGAVEVTPRAVPEVRSHDGDPAASDSRSLASVTPTASWEGRCSSHHRSQEASRITGSDIRFCRKVCWFVISGS
jgi:hypothetical protein